MLTTRYVGDYWWGFWCWNVIYSFCVHQWIMLLGESHKCIIALSDGYNNRELKNLSNGTAAKEFSSPKLPTQVWLLLRIVMILGPTMMTLLILRSEWLWSSDLIKATLASVMTSEICQGCGWCRFFMRKQTIVLKVILAAVGTKSRTIEMCCPSLLYDTQEDISTSHLN